MKALSLLQPWASLIAWGEKRIETRSWPTSYRGPIAIHASKSPEFLHLLEGSPFLEAAYVHGVRDSAELPRGVVLATATLVDCRPTEALGAGLCPWERAFGNYEPGRWGFLLADVQPLPEPVLARGRLGLWEWASHNPHCQ